MKREVYLNYSSIITGLGSLDQTWKSILHHQSGVIQKTHFENDLLPKTGLSLFERGLSETKVNFTQHLMAKCLDGFPKLPEDTFLIWTGIKNNTETIESLHDGGESPRLSSARDFRSWLIDLLGLSNGGMEINAACASSTVGVTLATQYITEGRYDHVLVVGADIVSRFVYYGFASLKAMTEEVCKPFDNNRNGLSLGDGAVALYLSAQRQSDLRVAGCGITNDANHITGPSRDGLGLSLAMQQAINMSGLEPKDIEAFCAHGTGTKYNDSMELMAVRSLFGDTPPMVFGVKGAIGHTLGAAGGIEVALCGKCLTEGTIPPTVRCNDPQSSEILLEKTPFAGRHILTSNSGFGGVNAAVLLEKLL